MKKSNLIFSLLAFAGIGNAGPANGSVAPPVIVHKTSDEQIRFRGSRYGKVSVASQRKTRKARRRAHAAGKRNAFAR